MSIRTPEAGTVALQDLYRSRGHLDPDYDRVAMGLDTQILQEEEARLAQDIQIGTRLSRTQYQYVLVGSDPSVFSEWAGRMLGASIRYITSGCGPFTSGWNTNVFMVPSGVARSIVDSGAAT